MSAYDYDAMVFMDRVERRLGLAYVRAKEAMERAEVAATTLARLQPLTAAEVTLEAGVKEFEPAVRSVLEDLDRSTSQPGGPAGYGVRLATEHALRRLKGKLRVAAPAYLARFEISPRMDELRVQFDRKLDDLLECALGLSSALGRRPPEKGRADFASGEDELVFDDPHSIGRSSEWTLYDLEALASGGADQMVGSAAVNPRSEARQASITDVFRQMWRRRSGPAA